MPGKNDPLRRLRLLRSLQPAGVVLDKSGAMTYSQFFILSSRGDVIISRDCTASSFVALCASVAAALAAGGGGPLRAPFSFLCGLRFSPPPPDRGDLPRATAELFFRTVKKDKSGGKPFFVADGVTYIHMSALVAAGPRPCADRRVDRAPRALLCAHDAVQRVAGLLGRAAEPRLRSGDGPTHPRCATHLRASLQPSSRITAA